MKSNVWRTGLHFQKVYFYKVITKVRLSAKQNRQEPRNRTLNQVPGPLHIIFMKYNIIYDGYPPPLFGLKESVYFQIWF